MTTKRLELAITTFLGLLLRLRLEVYLRSLILIYLTKYLRS